MRDVITNTRTNTMTQQEKLTALSTAYTTKKVDDARESIIIQNEDCPAHEAIQDIQFKNATSDSGITFDLAYDIMSDACNVLSDIELKDLKEADFYELTAGIASVYTDDRLAYLNIYNQQDAADIMKEYSTQDIATACAIWYDQRVQEACEALRSWVLETSDN